MEFCRKNNFNKARTGPKAVARFKSEVYSKSVQSKKKNNSSNY